MYHPVLAQAGSNEFATQVIAYLAAAFGGFFISLYIFRAIFNIPTFLRYQKAQIRLLEEIAKTQGVDNKKVKHIISESVGWDTTNERQA